MTDHEYLWYIPNEVQAGHRGDVTTADHNSLDALAGQAQAVESAGFRGALIGTSWGRPDTLTVATALVARTRTFEPLVAVRPGYWHPAHFAATAATLDHLSGGRVRVNVVSGQDRLEAYGDSEGDQAGRYERTSEFIEVVRRLWTESDVTFAGRHFHVTGSTVGSRVYSRPGRPHPLLYFGGASPAAERVAAAQADVQLFWGEPRDDIAERIARLRALSDQLGRVHPPLRFGLRITTLIRDTSDEAWDAAHAKIELLASRHTERSADYSRTLAIGQRRLLDLQARGEVLDDNLFTTPGKVGGGGAGTTWLVGSPDEVATSLRRYADLGISHFVLSDTPYLTEVERQGRQLLPLLSEVP